MKSLIIDVENNFKKNKSTWFSLAIFVLVFFTLGIPFTKWGFFTDDFGNVFHAQVKSVRDVGRFFYEGSAINFIMPSNYTAPTNESFDTICYHPLTFVYYYIQSLFFGTNAYGYYLVTIFLHALNSMILFNLFLIFLSYPGSFLATAFFAFHPSLANWLGWLAAQQNQITLTFILLIFILLKKYLDSKKIAYYIMGLILFIVSLFTREITLVMPVALGLVMYVYQKDILKVRFKSFYSLTLHYVIILGPFFSFALFYLFLRRWLFASDTSVFALVLTRLLSLAGRGYQLVAFFTDLLGLSWLPWGYPNLKGLIFFIVFFAVCWLFIRSTQKLYTLIFSFLAVLFFWPAIIQTHDARFLYEALPFFILAFVSLIRFFDGNFLKTRKFAYALLVPLVIFNGSFLIFNLKCREENYHKVEVAFDDLVYNLKLKNRSLCFVGIPAQLSPFAHAVWLRDGNLKRDVFYAQNTFAASYGNLPTLNKLFGVKVNHYFDANENFDVNLLQVSLLDGRLNLKSLDTKQLSFRSAGSNNGSLSIGQTVVNKRDEFGRVSDFDLILSDKYRFRDLAFVTWDYKNKKFIVLEQQV